MLTSRLLQVVESFPEPVQVPDAELIGRVLEGETDAFEPLVIRHQPRVFAIARKYARLESEVQDIVQEVFLKAFEKLSSYRAEAPFEHWLSRMAVRTCFDFLRKHQRNRETPASELGDQERDWLNGVAAKPLDDLDAQDGARALVHRILEQLTPADRMVIQLLEIEDRSVKEVAFLTGWSATAVKVRAFRARAAMKRVLAKIQTSGYL